MKKTLNFLILGFCLLQLFADNFLDNYSYNVSPPMEIYFEPNFKVKIQDLESSPEEQVFDYKINYKGKLPFIRLFFDMPYSSHFPGNGKYEYLILACKYFCRFIGKNNKVVKGYEFSQWTTEFPFGFKNWCDSAKASNELVEGNIRYSVDSLFDLNNFNTCLAIPNNGKNESVIFDCSKISPDEKKENLILADDEVQLLAIISGYVNYSKPELYTDNARPKKIKFSLYNPSTKKTAVQIFDLKDSPQPQILSFDNVLRGHIITMEVLEVYPGEKYNDLCISKLWECRTGKKWLNIK